MRISEQWLRDWVDVPESTDALAHRLTMAGLEVDAVEPAAPAFSGVVVGEIVSCEPHPDADKLRVCRVDGGGETLDVVCGAPNARAGLKAPFATVGGELPGGMAIRRAKLRGVSSSGMLCSAKELGLADDASGLMELPADAPVGTDLRAYLDLDDTVIEVDLTPNRGDCLGMIGVAREVGVVCGRDVAAPAAEPVPAAIDDERAVSLPAPAACPRYLGRVVRGVDATAESPLWLRERLRRAGVRPLSVCVDVTNYVMLELGQPMHAFDAARLTGGIRARLAEAGETLALLNGETVTLDAETLVIADDNGPVAMAGVMGGEPTSVTDATTDIFLEAAFFAPTAIAGRARAYGLHTDSSHRFERGVDPAMAAHAMERATALITAIAGGRPGPVTEAVDADHLPTAGSVALRPQRVRQLLGAPVDDDTMRTILERLGMPVAVSGDAWNVTVPSWRFDIAREVDLIEEIARVHGYDELPVSRATTPLAMDAVPEETIALRRLRHVLVDRGYQEAITYSFVSAELGDQLDPDHTALPLANPLSADLGVMRTSLWPGLVRAVQHNRNRQIERIRLFESGLRFRGTIGELEQTPTIAGVVTGGAAPEHWDGKARPVDFFDAKADVEALLALAGGTAVFAFEPATHPALHPGQSARIRRDGETVGWLGALHPRLARELELDGAVYLFELNLGDLQRGALPAFEPLSRYPSIRRDLALVLDEGVTAGELRRVTAGAAGEWLRDLVVFDVYQGKGVPDGRKSVAMGLILQDSSRTLTDSDVEGTVERVVGRLKQELDADLRE